MKRILFFLLMSLSSLTLAQERILNIYAWTGEIPDSVIKQFENETGINTNFSMYQNNEIMFAKLRASHQAGYDVVMPSSYFVDRMSRLGMLEKLDKSKIKNFKNLDSEFAHPIYDKNLDYSIPFIWGVTGIFVNKQYWKPDSVNKWSDLWDARFDNKLLLLDDNREVFSMALLSLGYSANDQDPEHIKQAYEHLKLLQKNIKVYSSETVISILIDEDATVGMAWSGDVFKANQDNTDVQFIFPQDKFIIWVDNFSIPKNAPHKEEAYEFLNFMLRPDIAKQIALATGFPVTNSEGEKLLPAKIRNNQTIYPSREVLKRGEFQIDVGEKTLNLYERYWEQLKMGG